MNFCFRTDMTRLDRYLMVTYGFISALGYEALTVNQLFLRNSEDLGMR